MKVEIFDNTDGRLVKIIEWPGNDFNEGAADGLLKAFIPLAWELEPKDGFTVYITYDNDVHGYSALSKEWQRVPVQPTEEMLEAGERGVDEAFNGTKDVSMRQSITTCWEYMLAAAPAPDAV